MNELKIFENPEFGKIRTMEINGEPWFVGKDVADILGYSNSRKTIADHVDGEDKGVTKCYTHGGAQDLVIINESGLYTLILSSKLPAAKAFKRWVTAEVIPSIRKHGMYATPVMIDNILANPDFGIKLLQELKAEREHRAKLEETVTVQTQQIAEMTPKANYYDTVLSCPDALPITVIAKDYGWSGKRLNTFLHDNGVQYKMHRVWLLYQQYAAMGYTKTQTVTYTDNDGNAHAVTHTKWTQKGRLFIYDLMKSAGNLPLIEQEDE